jgi:hypothetical protein
MTNRVNFFNFSDDKLFYDERKKRFVFLEDAPAIVHKEMNNSHFKEVSILMLNLLFSKGQTCLDKSSLSSETSLSMDSNF